MISLFGARLWILLHLAGALMTGWGYGVQHPTKYRSGTTTRERIACFVVHAKAGTSTAQPTSYTQRTVDITMRVRKVQQLNLTIPNLPRFDR